MTARSMQDCATPVFESRESRQDSRTPRWQDNRYGRDFRQLFRLVHVECLFMFAAVAAVDNSVDFHTKEEVTVRQILAYSASVVFDYILHFQELFRKSFSRSSDCPAPQDSHLRGR